jgi:uncharacterized membrane protein
VPVRRYVTVAPRSTPYKPLQRAPSVSATLPIPPSLSTPSHRGHAVAIVLAAYVVALALALASGSPWLAGLAVFLLATLLLSGGLRRRSGIAIALWIGAGIASLLLAGSDRGRFALDFTPAMVNAALSVLFARTLADPRGPLIARAISVLESPERLALPRVAGYARALTLAWALVLGVQALLLTLLLACAVPDGLLASYGIASPIPVDGSRWRWYLHFGSYAAVLAFLVVEYAFRRWYLRHIAHVSLPIFVMRLARRWPALARSAVDDGPARTDA